jgi:hypothetical protein
MTQPGWVRAYRAAFALLTLGTILYLFRHREDIGDPTQAEQSPDDSPLTGHAEHAGFGDDMIRFFSFFTIQSNLIAAAVFLFQAASGQSAGRPPLARDLLRGASLLYLATTAIVYQLLAQEVDTEGGSVSWIDSVLHRIMPLAVVVDWLVQPPTNRLRYRHALVWTIYPLLWLAVTLGRGRTSGWYPYPFLDPASAGGYRGVAAICGAIAGGFLLGSWFVVALGGLARRRFARGA